MTKHIISVLTILLFIVSSNAQVSQISESVYFDTDKFEIRTIEEKKLLHLLDSISSDSILSVSIAGHTDNSADSLYNIALSKNRSNAVQRFLIDKGIKKEVFQVNYHGENKPVANNISDQGKQKNRRVDLTISYQRSNSEVIKDTVLQEVDPCIGVDTTIILENGTELVFNKCEYINIQECLQIKTIRTTDELIENEVQLTTNDNIPLVTCGMIGICINPSCNVEINCFDHPVKVRFPYPDDSLSCLPCRMGSARVFNQNGAGTWTGVDGNQEKVEIIEVGNVKYYQLEIECPDCGGMKNCDCPRCDDLPKKIKKKVCPKVKLKLPFRYELIEASIFIDCPPTILSFTPDKTRIIKRRNVAKTETKCFNGDHRIQVLALDNKGDTVRVSLRPLAEIKHRILFSHCKLEERDNQKVLGIFASKKRAMYRKYKVRKRDFSE